MDNIPVFNPNETDNVLSNVSSILENGTLLPHEGGETETCRIFRFALYTIVCGLLCALGFLGNTFSFLVLHKDKSTPVASFLLQVMAVADNLFLILWFIHYSVRDIFRYWNIDAKEHPVWLYVRVYTFPLMYMAQMQTIWLTVVVALNRFMAVCLPYRAPTFCNIQNVYKEVILVSAFTIAYNVPRFFELEVVTDANNKTTAIRTAIGNDDLYKTVFTDAMYYLFTFVLPLLLLAFVNTKVIISYQAILKRKRRLTSRRAENENNITLVMIMVVVIFIICQAPARIVQVVWNYNFAHCEEYQWYLIHISNSLEVLNSSVNFLIYFIFRKRFRDILREYYCIYGPCKLGDSASSGLNGLTEYQSSPDKTTTTSVGQSIRQILFRKKDKVRANGVKMSDKCVANNPEMEPLATKRTIAEVSYMKQDSMDKVDSRCNKVEPLTVYTEKLDTGNTVCVTIDEDKQEVVEGDLSSDNHPCSRSSSTENCINTEGNMLVASV